MAVAGGTGVVGRHVVVAATAAGHTPVVLSRKHGVDVTTGRGLDTALAGVDAVIDVSNMMTIARRRSVRFFVAATENLLEAGRSAGVRHHVALSIVGADRVDFGYYYGKRAQEELVLSGGVPGSVLRATQFHEFAGQLLTRSPGPVAFVPRMRSQPVAAAEVAAALVDLAAGPAVGQAPEMAGPEVHEMLDLARRVVAATGQRRAVVPLPLPGAVGRAMAGGALLPTGPGPRGQQTFASWLEASGGRTD
jgi:uncharacterized protein YbjT (DUF2867 family)